MKKGKKQLKINANKINNKEELVKINNSRNT